MGGSRQIYLQEQKIKSQKNERDEDIYENFQKVIKEELNEKEKIFNALV